MAITNAIESGATNLTTLGRGVTAGRLRRHKNWIASPLLQFAEPMEVPQGNTQTRAVSIAEFGAGGVAAFTENTAMNATALPAVEANSSSLAEYGIGWAMTSQAMQVVENIDELIGTLDTLSVEALMDFVAHGTSVGIAPLASGMTTVTTTSGLACTINAVETGALAIWNTFGSNLPLVFIASPKGIRDLRNDLKASGAGAMANEAASELVKRMFVDGAIPDGMGFCFELGGIAYFQVNRSSQIYATGGNDYGILMVAPTAWDKIQAPIALAGRADPAIARPNRVILASIGPIGIARYEVEPDGENARRWQYVLDMDAFVTHSTSASLPARAILYSTT